MSTDIKINDFHKVCRLCLSFTDLQPIFHEKHRKLISSLTDIQIQESDGFPKNICKKCLKQLENIAYFVEICLTSNDTLNAILSHSECKDEEEINYQNVLSSDDDDSKSNSCKRSPYELLKEDIDSEYHNLDTEPNIHISCPECGENFQSKQNLQEHFEEIPECRTSYISHITPKNDKNILEEQKIKSELFDNEQEYVRGKLIKGKRKFLCNYCGKNYTRKNGLDRHIMSHTGTKPFECKECGKCYITKNTLKTHMLIHTGIKTHKCQICNKSFIQSSHLNYHMRRHAGEKPHTCTFCGKGFLSTYHLERHKLMHTGVKPFKCDMCDKQFVRSTTLRDHILLHTREKPFLCQHCGKQFNRKQTLTNHVNLVHLEGGTNVINNNYPTFKQDNMPKQECM